MAVDDRLAENVDLRQLREICMVKLFAISTPRGYNN
jgi:hypothetical protein